MKYAYPACFYQEDDGRFSVVFTDFELATFGDGLADAMRMAADAGAGRILSMLNDGEKLPQPSNIKNIRLEDSSGFASMVYIDLENFKTGCDKSPVKNTLIEEITQ
jgi:predicted RNase H-like HicB family nuclease